MNREKFASFSFIGKNCMIKKYYRTYTFKKLDEQQKKYEKRLT